MGLYAKTILFARRLWVFYLLIGIFSAFFGAFYYRYLPANEAELDTRGFRILDQLTKNMIEKDTTLLGAFRNADCNQCQAGTKTAVLHQIRDQIRFETAGISQYPKSDSLGFVPGLGWCMMYRIAPQKKDTATSLVRISDFIEPVLSARTDLFENYVLLSRRETRPAQLEVLYLRQTLSTSYEFNADSALSLQKNSDLADISTVSIGGEAYNLFLQPFEFAGRHLFLGGLVRKADYDRQVKSLPPHFVVGMILVILLGLIALPFVKVFFISQNESISKSDVLRTTLSIYLGSAIFVLAGAYFLADTSAHYLVQDRLKTISDSLNEDIRQDLTAAEYQFRDYLDQYKKLDPSYAAILSYHEGDSAKTTELDELFTPFDYPLSARVFWFDSVGATLAKWNPFGFLSPPSSIKNYPFFTQLHTKNPDDTSFVLSAGKSNITGEFQMFLSRRVRQPIYMRDEAKNNYDTSFGVLMPFYLHSGLHPVLPRGFGFCLIDNRSMNVLMHSDARRNLSENLYLETNSNERLRNVIDHKMKTCIDDVALYGSSHTFYSRPVDGQQISLVVFYDDDSHSLNIFRLIHFGAEALLYMAVLFIVCLLLSTARVCSPSKLSFTINPVEWIRPRYRNLRSYHCTWRYFIDLLIISLCFYGVMLVAQLDIRIAFYISIFLPFYALWSFVSSRRKETPRFPDSKPIPLDEPAPLPTPPKTSNSWLNTVREIIASAKTVVVTLVLLNLFVFQVIRKWQMDQDADHHYVGVVLFVIGFELLAILFHILRFRQNFSEKTASPDAAMDPGKETTKHIPAYLHSLYFSVFVITIIPAMGFLWYGWSVEKIQYNRGDQLTIMVENEEHIHYVSHLLNQYKPGVIAELEYCAPYKDSLLYKGCRYLANEKITPLPHGWTGDKTASPLPDPDEPYITFLDQFFIITAGEYNSYSIGLNAADTSWLFVPHIPDDLTLVRPLAQDYPRRADNPGTDPMYRDFKITVPLESSLFSADSFGLFQYILFALLLTMFILGLWPLFRYTAQRLFLIDAISRDIPKDEAFLVKYFPEGFHQDDFLGPKENRAPMDEQEQYILETLTTYKTQYENIWKALPSSERYFVYDFASDGYTNYKDFKKLYSLLKKGLLYRNQDKFHLFAVSFREFVLQKKGSQEIARLKDRYSVPGLWATIRIPTLIVIMACAGLLLLTQENVSHKVTVMVTSAGAIVPVILELTKKFTSKGAA